MTFLQILQLAHTFLGLGSRGNTAKPGTVPTSAASQVDELGELVTWGIRAITNFQLMYKWGWLIQAGTLPFVTGDSTVVPTATLTNYRDLIPFLDGGGGRYVLCYVTADGQTNEQRVYLREPADFLGLLDREEVPTGRPMFLTINPDQTWQVYPEPDQNYTLRFNYLYKPKVFTTSDSSVNFEDWPTQGRGLPAEHHEVLAWAIVRYWAATRNKPDIYAIADKNFREQLAPIKGRYLPTARI